MTEARVGALGWFDVTETVIVLFRMGLAFDTVAAQLGAGTGGGATTVLVVAIVAVEMTVVVETVVVAIGVVVAGRLVVVVAEGVDVGAVKTSSDEGAWFLLPVAATARTTAAASRPHRGTARRLNVPSVCPTPTFRDARTTT